MTAALAHPPPTAVAIPAPPGPPPAAEPAERGSLRIDPSVLRKVAEHTADRNPGTLPAPRTVAGVGIGSTGATAKVSCTGQLVDLRVDVALCYPGPLHSTVDQLRSRIGEEIRRITGYQVRSIAVTVTALLPEPRSGLR